MEKALSAYSTEHILRYFSDVKANGLTEHGFPRLTADIGILISHGIRGDLLPIFLEMMEFCCKTIPKVKAANDFSVREIVCCLIETERSGIVPNTDIERWRKYLSAIEPTGCYDKFATSVSDNVRNWALFSGVSEFFRQNAGLCSSDEFIELQFCQQLSFFDENGMYMDNAKSENHQPIMYDIVPRALYSLALDQGYRGKGYDEIDRNLKKAGLLTLDTQSPSGEMAFGGRSNQFLHNEAWLISILEYEAKRYAREGNMPLAARFKAASQRAVESIEAWICKTPIRHIKNRFPTETKYGCESYAYFDKYMITVASAIYMAYLICDDLIPFEPCRDHAPCAAVTTKNFHKLFLKSGGYGLEFDLDADSRYDASGLGRVHREDAPPAIALSSPCPSLPGYAVDIEPFAFSLCSALYEAEGWRIAAQSDCEYEIADSHTDDDKAVAKLISKYGGEKNIEEVYTVCKDGVSIKLNGKGKIGFTLPAFMFDGESYTEISVGDRNLTVRYDGWECRYETDGEISDLMKTAANRNGHYGAFIAHAENALNVKIEIIKAQ